MTVQVIELNPHPRGCWQFGFSCVWRSQSAGRGGEHDYVTKHHIARYHGLERGVMPANIAMEHAPGEWLRWWSVPGERAYGFEAVATIGFV
jgi:hypothetical protein